MIIFSLKSANLGQKRKRTRIEIDQFPFDQINAYNISPQHGRKFLQIFFIFWLYCSIWVILFGSWDFFIGGGGFLSRWSL